MFTSFDTDFFFQLFPPSVLWPWWPCGAQRNTCFTTHCSLSSLLLTVCSSHFHFLLLSWDSTGKYSFPP